MIDNSTNINKTNNYLSPQTILTPKKQKNNIGLAVQHFTQNISSKIIWFLPTNMYAVSFYINVYVNIIMRIKTSFLLSLYHIWLKIYVLHMFLHTCVTCVMLGFLILSHLCFNMCFKVKFQILEAIFKVKLTLPLTWFFENMEYRIRSLLTCIKKKQKTKIVVYCVPRSLINLL